MEHFYCIWVDLQNKLISLVETKGFQKLTYEPRAAFEKVWQLLGADGFRRAAG